MLPRTEDLAPAKDRTFVPNFLGDGITFLWDRGDVAEVLHLSLVEEYIFVEQCLEWVHKGEDVYEAAYRTIDIDYDRGNWDYIQTFEPDQLEDLWTWLIGVGVPEGDLDYTKQRLNSYYFRPLEKEEQDVY